MDYETRTRRLNAVASTMGWKAALQEIYPDLISYLDRPSPFLNLLPIGAAKVLEIGPGFGQFTELIASKAEAVEALEVDAGQAEFLRERVRQEGIRNVRVTTGGGDCRLPYADETFNVVVLNLVFEWCASRMYGNHSEGQQLMLAETFRVLRRGGHLYLATKNRYALKYLMGKPDEHFAGMRFGSALPRPVANFLHGRRSSGKLYSYRGLKKMLRQNGFIVKQTWWAAPEMRHTRVMIPTDTASIRTARQNGVLQGPSRLERLTMKMVPAPLVRYLTPGLAFLALKN